MAVMSAALAMPKQYLKQYKSIQVVLLLLGLPLMWLVASGIVYAVMGYGLFLALAIGAILTPIDPVVSATIVSGETATKYLPSRIRDTISFEAGANDGLALPLVMLGVLLLELPAGAAMEHWFLEVLLWENAGGLLLGLSLGWVLGRLLNYAHLKDYMTNQTLFAFSVAVVFLLLGGVSFIGMNSIVSVFAAGLMLNRVLNSHDELQQERVQESMERVFTIPVFVFLGLVLPVEQWLMMGWQGITVALGILLLKRLPVYLLLRPVIPQLKNKADMAMVGWFGPVGVAALFYAFLVFERTGQAEIWHLTSLVVFASTVIHGLTSYGFSRWYARYTGRF